MQALINYIPFLVGIVPLVLLIAWIRLAVGRPGSTPPADPGSRTADIGFLEPFQETQWASH
mgnify:CR=1 FL=1